MTDITRERIAKNLLSVVRDIWCDRESDAKPFFNCYHCEFEDYGECRLKQFLKAEKYEIEYPIGLGQKGESDEKR